MKRPLMPAPMELDGLRTYSLADRPSKVFAEELGRPLSGDARLSDLFNSLPAQLAGKTLLRVRDELCRARDEGRTVVTAIGGHVIKTGCAPYLIDWIRQGAVTAVAMNGAAAIHDYELAAVGKTSEDVGACLHAGGFGMARETADAMAVASQLRPPAPLGSLALNDNTQAKPSDPSASTSSVSGAVSECWAVMTGRLKKGFSRSSAGRSVVPDTIKSFYSTL